jgi:hypothetical protein
MDPWVDFIGVPKEVEENGSRHLELVRPKDLQADEVEAIFFDELNRSHKKIRNAVMELIQFKSINGKKFNNLKVIWAAINPEDDEDEEYDVEKLDPAQKDRFHIHINIPYKPDKGYFTNKFGKSKAGLAISWWLSLDKKAQNLISPRRLDYCLEIQDKGGVISDVIDDSKLAGSFRSMMKTHHVLSKVEQLKASNDKQKTKEFINKSSNFSVLKKEVLWSVGTTDDEKALQKFLIPLIEVELIISLLGQKADSGVRSIIDEYWNTLETAKKEEITKAIKKLSPGVKGRVLGYNNKILKSMPDYKPDKTASKTNPTTFVTEVEKIIIDVNTSCNTNQRYGLLNHAMKKIIQHTKTTGYDLKATWKAACVISLDEREVIAKLFVALSRRSHYPTVLHMLKMYSVKHYSSELQQSLNSLPGHWTIKSKIRNALNQL